MTTFIFDHFIKPNYNIKTKNAKRLKLLIFVV